MTEATEEQTVDQSPEVLDAFAKQIKLDINPKLPSEERYGFLNLCYKYKDIFATSLSDIKIYPDYQLDIKLEIAAQGVAQCKVSATCVVADAALRRIG